MVGGSYGGWHATLKRSKTKRLTVACALSNFQPLKRSKTKRTPTPPCVAVLVEKKQN